MANNENNAFEPMDKKVGFGYAIGEVGCGVSWYMVNNYLTLYYTDVVGLSATAISLIMLIARIWDAVNDPMMGSIADKTKTRWGKFRPYLLFAPPFLAIFNILTFTVFPLQGAAKVIVCLICYILVGMAYTVVGIAQSAIVNVLALSSQGRMNLSTARGIGASVANILLSMIVMPAILFFSKSDSPNASGYFKLSLCMGVAMVICFFIEFKLCKEKYTDQLHAESDDKVVKASFIQNIKSLCQNDQLLLVVLQTLLGTICVTARMSLLTYYVIYVVGSYTLISPVFTIMTVAQLVGTLTVPFMTKRMGKKNYMIVLTVLMIVGFVAIHFWGAKSTPLLLVLSFICGLCNCASTLCYGMVSDSIEYGAWKLGVRQEALAGSMLSLSVKIATAICGAVGVLLLVKFGYVPNAEQTAEAMRGISFVVNIIPAICGVISLIPLLMYKLTEDRVGEIRAENALREGKTAEAE